MFKHLGVYVACSLTHAPQEFQNQVEQLKARLREFSHVLCFLGVGTDATARRIYRYDIHGCVSKSELVVAICDFPSIGLGMEIQRQIDRGHPVLAVGHQKSLISPMCLDTGEQGYEFCRYENLLTDVPEIVRRKLEIIDQSESSEVARLRWQASRATDEMVAA